MVPWREPLPESVRDCRAVDHGIGLNPGLPARAPAPIQMARTLRALSSAWLALLQNIHSVKLPEGRQHTASTDSTHLRFQRCRPTTTGGGSRLTFGLKVCRPGCRLAPAVTVPAPPSPALIAAFCFAPP